MLNGTGKSVANSIPVNTNKVVIVEGMAVGFSPAKEALDACIYIDIDKDSRYSRFMERAKTRNQDNEGAEYLFNYTEKSGEKYIKPIKDTADLVINGKCDLDYFKKIVEKVIR